MQNDTQEFYVHYKVRGFDGEKKAGPYVGANEAEAQRADIASFEGVYGVEVRTADGKPVRLVAIGYMYEAREIGA